MMNKHYLHFLLLILPLTSHAEEISRPTRRYPNFNVEFINPAPSMYKNILVINGMVDKTHYIQKTTGALNPYRKENSSQFLKVPVSMVENHFDAGDQYQVIDFNSGAKSNFTVGKEVFVEASSDPFDETPRYKEDGSQNLEFKEYIQVVFSYKPEEIIPNSELSSLLTGIAYKGSDLKLVPSIGKKPDYKPIPLSDERILKIMDHQASSDRYIMKATKAEMAKVNGFEFVRISGEYPVRPDYGGTPSGTGLLIKKNDNTYYSFDQYWSDSDYSASYQSFIFGDWIPGADFTLIKFDSGMHSCAELIYYMNQKFYSIKLDCDSGGC